MKDPDFAALEQGTVILLRPFGPGARDNDAQDRLVLAELGPATPLTPLGFGHYSGIPDWVPGGYIPHEGGKYRTVSLLRELPRLAESDDADAWEAFEHLGSGVRRAVLAREVIGPWGDVQEEALLARRERITARVHEREQEAEAQRQRQDEFDRALAVLRPHMNVTDHSALRDKARPGVRFFTVEEVARLIETAIGEKG